MVDGSIKDVDELIAVLIGMGAAISGNRKLLIVFLEATLENNTIKVGEIIMDPKLYGYKPVITGEVCGLNEITFFPIITNFGGFINRLCEWGLYVFVRGETVKAIFNKKIGNTTIEAGDFLKQITPEDYGYKFNKRDEDGVTFSPLNQ